jgi:predicted nucleotidyltransferase
METTKNKLTPYQISFFNRLSTYLDNKLYFFGSIQRNDYFPESSDIDVDIFTNNESATIVQMMNFLHVDRDQFKRFVWKLNVNGNLAKGHKIMYKEPDRKLAVEFSIYNEIYKPAVLYEHSQKSVIPFYASGMLIFIKILFYKLGLIPGILYTKLKGFILSYMIAKDKDHFVIIDYNKSS